VMFLNALSTPRSLIGESGVYWATSLQPVAIHRSDSIYWIGGYLRRDTKTIWSSWPTKEVGGALDSSFKVRNWLQARFR